MNRSISPWLSTLGFLLLAPCANAQLVYQSQNSKTTGYHSGIVTGADFFGSDVVWDTDFAKMAYGALGKNYNEAAFAFMQCYGGGMIDELKAADSGKAVYTSAARYSESSFYTKRDPDSDNKSESAFGIHFAPAAGGAVKTSFKDAVTVGIQKDLVGPVLKKPLIEHPQYTGDRIGDGIVLHQNNASNPNPNKNYLALVFGGTDDNKVMANLNSENRMVDALTARGYAAAEMKVLPPDSTAAELKKAFGWVAANTTADTQFYYWNNILHGALDFDVMDGVRASTGAGIQNGNLYSFQLPTDESADFLAQLQGLHDYYTAQNVTDLTLLPYFEVQSAEAITGLNILLNNRSLSAQGFSDIYGDQSVFSYRFMLDSQDLAFLEQNFSQQTDDTLAVSWAGSLDPGLMHVDINTGTGANAISADTPEPGPLAFLSAVLLVLGYRLRRKRAKGPVFVASRILPSSFTLPPNAIKIQNSGSKPLTDRNCYVKMTYTNV